VTLRPLRWWDIAPVLELERVLFPEQPWTAESFWAELALGSDRVYLVAEDPTDQLLGYAGLSCPPEARGGDAEVMTVAVAPEAQGRGVGQELVAALVACARERGAGRLMLEVRADNEAAQRLYTAMGFEQVATRRGYYRGAEVDGEPGAEVDALILSLPLSAGPGEPAAADSLAP